MQRFKTDTPFNDGGHNSLIRARRGHLTALEFSVPFLILLAVFELLGGSAPWIIGLGIAFLVTRLAHVLFMYRFDGRHFTRGIGTGGSHAVNIILVVMILMTVAM